MNGILKTLVAKLEQAIEGKVEAKREKIQTKQKERAKQRGRLGCNTSRGAKDQIKQKDQRVEEQI